MARFAKEIHQNDGFWLRSNPPSQPTDPHFRLLAKCCHLHERDPNFRVKDGPARMEGVRTFLRNVCRDGRIELVTWLIATKLFFRVRDMLQAYHATNEIWWSLSERTDLEELLARPTVRSNLLKLSFLQLDVARWIWGRPLITWKELKLVLLLMNDGERRGYFDTILVGEYYSKFNLLDLVWQHTPSLRGMINIELVIRSPIILHLSYSNAEGRAGLLCRAKLILQSVPNPEIRVIVNRFYTVPRDSYPGESESHWWKDLALDSFDKGYHQPWLTHRAFSADELVQLHKQDWQTLHPFLDFLGLPKELERIVVLYYRHHTPTFPIDPPH